MSRVPQPFDFLELDEFSNLKTVLQDNYALLHGEYRPLEEFDKIARSFARDFLRNYLRDLYAGKYPDEEIERIITEYEKFNYGREATKPEP